MKITSQIINKHGLKPEEYENIKKLLNREPNLLELGIFSAMWNEHCSYKSSRIHLKKLPTKGKQVIQGPGENAGVIHRTLPRCCNRSWRNIKRCIYNGS